MGLRKKLHFRQEDGMNRSAPKKNPFQKFPRPNPDEESRKLVTQLQFWKMGKEKAPEEKTGVCAPKELNFTRTTQRRY